MDSGNNINDFDYDYKKSYRHDYIAFMKLSESKKYEEVLDEYGGNPLYLSRKESYDRELRNWKIYRDYKNGMDYFELTSKYKLSITTIRNITAQCHEKDKNETDNDK